VKDECQDAETYLFGPLLRGNTPHRAFGYWRCCCFGWV